MSKAQTIAINAKEKESVCQKSKFEISVPFQKDGVDDKSVIHHLATITSICMKNPACKALVSTSDRLEDKTKKIKTFETLPSNSDMEEIHQKREFHDTWKSSDKRKKTSLSIQKMSETSNMHKVENGQSYSLNQINDHSYKERLHHTDANEHSSNEKEHKENLKISLSSKSNKLLDVNISSNQEKSSIEYIKPIHERSIRIAHFDDTANKCESLNDYLMSKYPQSQNLEHNLCICSTNTKITPAEKCVSPKIALIHSTDYSKLLHDVTHSLHGDRDILLSSLFECCGFIDPKTKQSNLPFFKVLPPKLATIKHMNAYFHSLDYLKILQYEKDHDNGNLSPNPKKVHFAPPIYSPDVLESYGLIDDCPLPSSPTLHHNFWKYCQFTAGSSLFAAHLLLSSIDKKKGYDVAMHWGGGRHHAQRSQANGFCYVNDVVLAIQHLIQGPPSSSTTTTTTINNDRVLYFDIDIHHGDAVQSAFYDSDRVLCCSFHRYAKSFFPFPHGNINEKGKGEGLGYNINIPLPRQCTDTSFEMIWKHAVDKLVSEYKPKYVVVCVGADGLKGDPLVKGMGDDGWNLSPKGIAQCVKYVTTICKENEVKLLLLGGGGYNDTKTAMTYLLCTASACEGVSPGLFNKLPRDIPRHEYFCRYGPSFELILDNGCEEMNIQVSEDYHKMFENGKRAICLAAAYIHGKRMETEGKLESRSYVSEAYKGDDIENEFWSKKKKRKLVRRASKKQENDEKQ